MKKTELVKLRNKKLSELEKSIKEKRLELTKLQAELGANAGKNLKKAKNLKHDIAQMKTIFKEKEIISQLEDTRKKDK